MLTYNDATHTYTDEAGQRVPSVSQILQHAGCYSPKFIKAEVLARGTAVHEYCEAWDWNDGPMPAYPDEYKGYILAWVKFCEVEKWKAERIEGLVDVTVPMTDGRKLRYGGRYDRIGKIKGVATLLDIKTSSNGACPKWHKYQLTAYNRNVKLPTAGVYLMPDGNYKLRQHEEKLADWLTFAGYLGRWYDDNC